MNRVATVLALVCALIGSAGSVALAEEVPVWFEIQTPPSTPEGATLWLCGNVSALGAWNGRGVQLAAIGGGRYTVSVLLNRGDALEFKVTRGGWDTVEKGAGGAEIANRTWTVSGSDTVRGSVLAWRDQTEGPATARRSTLTGDIRVHEGVRSAHVAARTVRVWLPPGYASDSLRHYPVFYFHDGNNVFDEATSFLGVEWGADEAADRVVRSGRTEPFIVVAVDNTPDRMSEYTPVADAKFGGGGAGRYARFLIEELKPFIDRTYRTLPEPASTGVVGSSLGGLVSLWLGLEHPEVFGRIGAVSPSASWGDGELARRVAAGSSTGLRIWLDIGTFEGNGVAGSARVVQGVRAVRDALITRGYREGVDFHHEEIEGAFHNEEAWAARVERIMVFLLGGAAAPPAPR